MCCSSSLFALLFRPNNVFLERLSIAEHSHSNFGSNLWSLLIFPIPLNNWLSGYQNAWEHTFFANNFLPQNISTLYSCFASDVFNCRYSLSHYGDKINLIATLPGSVASRSVRHGGAVGGTPIFEGWIVHFVLQVLLLHLKLITHKLITYNVIFTNKFKWLFSLFKIWIL